MDEYVDWESMYRTVEMLGIRGYEMQHFDICKRLWKTKVPKSGQADTLQGELLREVEKLRCEGMDNGNINWDEDFVWFCGHLAEVFEKSGLFGAEHLAKLKEALNYLRECGDYAHRYCIGEISEEEADPVRFAYTDDDIYDFISDAVAEFAVANPEDIPFEKPVFLYR